MTYGYYDYLENYYEGYYDYFYEYTYWPAYYANSTYNGTYPPSPYDYVQPYNMDVINPILLTISTLCAILSVIIGGITFYKMYVNKKLPKLIIILTSVCLTPHIVLNVIDPISYYAWFINFDADTNIEWDIYIVWDVFWVLSKVSLYILFMYRYAVIYSAAAKFNAAQLMYSQPAKYIIFTSFSLIIVIQIVLISMYMTYYYAYIKNGYDAKAERMYLNFCWSFLVVDLLFVGLLSYLLVRSIIKLIVDIDNSHHEKMDDNIAHRISMKTQNNVINLELSDINSTITNMESEISSNAASRSKTEDDLDQQEQERARKRIPTMTDTQGTTTCTTTPSIDQTNDIKAIKKKKRKREKIIKNKSREQTKLLTTATRICVTCAISMLSSFVWQLLWLIGEELDHNGLLWLTYTWCVDSVINILCVYLSMVLAEKHYKYICKNVCKCHQCCLIAIIKIVDCQIKKK